MRDRSVVVTGAAQGIGLATSVLLSQEGWAVVGIDINEQGLDDLQRSVPNVGTVVGDIAKTATLERALAKADAMAALEGWVNNAAIMPNGRLDEISVKSIERDLAVNLTASIVGAQLAVRSFLRSGRPGAIVNVSSVHGRVGYPGAAVYDASKGGLEAFTRYVCVEYGHRGIRCNAIAPGVVVTPAMMADTSSAGLAHLRSLEVFAPMKALIPTAYYASVISYLLSDAAQYINGHVMAVDGGQITRCYAFDEDPAIPGVDR